MYLLANSKEDENGEDEREKVRAGEHVNVEQEACDDRERPPTGIGDAEILALYSRL